MIEPEKKDPKGLVPLTGPVFHILLCLTNGDSHGYGIMQETRARTGGEFKTGPGNLYRSLVTLVDEGMIEDVGEKVDSKTGKTRHYYRLKEFGEQVLEADIRRREHEVDLARAVVGRPPGLLPRPTESGP